MKGSLLLGAFVAVSLFFYAGLSRRGTRKDVIVVLLVQLGSFLYFPLLYLTIQGGRLVPALFASSAYFPFSVTALVLMALVVWRDGNETVAATQKNLLILLGGSWLVWSTGAAVLLSTTKQKGIENLVLEPIILGVVVGLVFSLNSVAHKHFPRLCRVAVWTVALLGPVILWLAIPKLGPSFH